MFAGQLNPGACVSLTVTVKLQVATLFAESVTLQETGVVPAGKVEPAGGEQTMNRPGQLSVATGIG
jgi:hypothetical protein